MFFPSVRARDITNGCEVCSNDANTWRGESHEDFVTKTARFIELGNTNMLLDKSPTTWPTQSRDYSLVGRSSTSENGLRGFDSQHDNIFSVKKA